MADKPKVAVIYYSATGHAHLVAKAIEEGAKAAGAEVRLRKVREIASPEMIASNPTWKAHVDATKDIPEASNADLEWADGYVFGGGARYGTLPAALKVFFESAMPLWGTGKLSNKPAAAFTGALNAHGGQETALHTIYNVMHHWGAVIVSPGFTDPSIYAAGGNPYGVSYSGNMQKTSVAEETLVAARYLGGRIARYAAVLAANRDRLLAQPVGSMN